MVARAVVPDAAHLSRLLAAMATRRGFAPGARAEHPGHAATPPGSSPISPGLRATFPWLGRAKGGALREISPRSRAELRPEGRPLRPPSRAFALGPRSCARGRRLPKADLLRARAAETAAAGKIRPGCLAHKANQTHRNPVKGARIRKRKGSPILKSEQPSFGDPTAHGPDSVGAGAQQRAAVGAERRAATVAGRPFGLGAPS